MGTPTTTERSQLHRNLKTRKSWGALLKARHSKGLFKKMGKAKRLMEASWWERLVEGETGSCSEGQGHAQSIFNPIFCWWAGLYFFPVVWPEAKLWWRFSSVQLLSRVWLFATPWIVAHQASLSITNCRSSLKLMSVKSVMPSSHLILCHPLFLLPPNPPSITVNSSHEEAKVLEFQL